jgi:hypothetical protein
MEGYGNVAEKPEETAAMIGTIETVPVPEKAV